MLLLSAVSVSAQNDEQIIRKGNRNYRRGNYTEAEAYYRKVLEEHPENVKALFNLGDALFGQKNYDAAIETFQKVVDMSADDKLRSNAAYNKGNCLLEQGKYYEAFGVYKDALAINPDNEDALYNLEYCRAHLVKSKIFVDPQIEHGRVEANKTEAINGQLVKLSNKCLMCMA